MKYFCPISVVIQEIENNIDDITLVFDLPFNGMCLFFLRNNVYEKLTVTSVLE